MNKKEAKKVAVNSFNATWDLIDKKDRSKADEVQMITLAHKSLHHWKLAGGTELNVVRGEWMLSHVYSVLGIGEAALYHAKLCYDQTLQHKFGDFDLVFAYEAMAYACKVLGEDERKNKFLDEGYKAAELCGKKGDREYCISQLDLLK